MVYGGVGRVGEFWSLAQIWKAAWEDRDTPGEAQGQAMGPLGESKTAGKRGPRIRKLGRGRTNATNLMVAEITG